MSVRSLTVTSEREEDRRGRRIKGPSALGSHPKRLWQLTWALAKTEFKLAFFGSLLGYLWQLMRPLLLFAVIFVVISVAGGKHITKGVPLYPVSVLLGIVLFTFFSEATAGGVTSIVDRESLVRKVELPRLAVPLATVLKALMNLILNTVPVIVLLFATGGQARLSWLQMPVLIVLLALLSTGLAAILSVAYVRYRDVRPIWEVVLQMMFYGSPIFYPIAAVEGAHKLLGIHIEDVAHILLINPFAAILVQAAHSFINPRYPSAVQAIGGIGMLMIPIGITVVIVVFGVFIFDREAPKVAERL